MQSSSGQSFVTTPGENEEVELTACEATIIEDIQPLDEDADETPLSQASQISVPEEEAFGATRRKSKMRDDRH